MVEENGQEFTFEYKGNKYRLKLTEDFIKTIKQYHNPEYLITIFGSNNSFGMYVEKVDE